MPETKMGTAALHSPERPLSGYAQVAEYLRREISLGRLRVGVRLPSERRLSEHLGVARETLRQALRVLEGSGHVIVQRGSQGGAFVQEVPVEPEEALRRIFAHKVQVLNVIECRTIIETGAARLAAIRRTEDDLTALESAQAELSGSENLHNSRASDTAFHLAIAQASGNSEISLAVEDLRVKMFHVVDVINFEFIQKTSLDAHSRILEAIRDADPDRAELEMRTHLATTLEEFEEILRTYGKAT